MSDYIDTREGWREVDYATWVAAADGVRLDTSDEKVRYWVREAPVPPIPTEPYTVIRAVAPIGPPRTLVLHHDGSWHSAVDTSLWSPAEVTAAISSFEVLAEPRAVTAKAAVDFLRENTFAAPEPIAQLARHFGVES